jgi:DNA-directed RNA polymerase subunit RPC12/RpoP
MSRRIDASCLGCGAMFSREEAVTDTENELSCPVCGASEVRGIPAQHSALTARANTRCSACKATFPRSEAETATKGVLACPVCGSTSDLEVREKSG